MDINEIIDSQIEALKELEVLLDEEKEMLIKDKGENLKAITDKKRAAAQKIAVIEKKRQEICGDKKAEDFLEEGTLSKKRFMEIKNLTEIVQEKNETNMILTRQSINYIHTIVNALNPKQKVITYGNNGRLDNNSLSAFSTKV